GDLGDAISLGLSETTATIRVDKSSIYFADWPACLPLMDILDPNQEVLTCDEVLEYEMKRRRAGELKAIFGD
ncbi:MAG: hypothetical protein ACREDR_04400, partial [Blastocatellia bacterium]